VSLCGSRLRRPTESPARRFQVECGLGKKHKPKQKRQAAAQPKEGAAPDIVPAQPAPRVDTSQLRLRTWKRLLKQHKQAQQPTAPKVAQSFRKPKVEDQERLAREAEREAAYQAARKKKSLAASFASLYGTKGNRQPPVLLVDGYNLLGQLAGYNSDDSEEEVHALLAAAFADGPRLALQNRLCDYSHLRQVKVVLVFDAIGSGSGTVIRTTAKGAIDVVYVGDADADTFIMLEVTALKERGTPQVLVATSDSDLRDSISGAHIVSCAALLREVTNAEKEAAERIRASQLTPWQERPGIGASVLSQNPGLYKKLNDMRGGRF
jgi:predicted RNA-binding protein with PIN domain